MWHALEAMCEMAFNNRWTRLGRATRATDAMALRSQLDMLANRARHVVHRHVGGPGTPVGGCGGHVDRACHYVVNADRGHARAAGTSYSVDRCGRWWGVCHAHPQLQPRSVQGACQASAAPTAVPWPPCLFLHMHGNPCQPPSRRHEGHISVRGVASSASASASESRITTAALG